MDKKILKLTRIAAAAVHLSGIALMVLGSTPLFLMPIMAGSLLLFLASDNQLRESNSVLLAGAGQAGRLIESSLLLGIIFESFNLLSRNRFYSGVPAEDLIQWPFFALVFALFAPLVLEVERFLENIGLAEVLTWKKVVVSKRQNLGLLWCGIILAIPLFWRPSFFYPLLWIVLILVTDPILNLLGNDEKSISGQFEEAYFGQAFRLLLAGISVGFLGEFWNFRSGIKWFHDDLGQTTYWLFELPLLEFWGYALIALGAFSFYQLHSMFHDWVTRKIGPGKAGLLIMLLLAILLIVLSQGMEHRTIASFRDLI